MATVRTGVGKHRKMCRWQGCRNYANLRDHDTSQAFCISCAVAMLYAAADPITDFCEFDDSTEYADALRARPILGLHGWPAR